MNTNKHEFFYSFNTDVADENFTMSYLLFDSFSGKEQTQKKFL